MTEHRILTPADLLAARAKLDLTQAELAKKLGVSLSAYHRWERGTIVPPVYLSLALAKLLDLHTPPAPPSE